VAALAASAELEANRYQVACVLGVEQMRNVEGTVAADHLGAAAWRDREGQEAKFLWPHLFNRLLEEYQRRYGLDYRHLMAIAEKNFGNAKRNPNAQTRRWTFGDDSFTENDGANPVVEGQIRRQDCSQITDGAAAIILASEDYAAAWANKRGVSLTEIPFIAGWGHRTGAMSLQEKLDQATADDYLFPHVRGTVTDAWRRAELPGIDAVDAIELHDCFSITEYMLTEHFGLAEPGQAWKAIEGSVTSRTGDTPVNASGGLIGGGHPVGATGVRMLLDAFRQITGTAGDYQVEGAKTVQTMNIGGSATTSTSFVISK
jgi:acetyl-CoA C-acetyltransferase